MMPKPLSGMLFMTSLHLLPLKKKLQETFGDKLPTADELQIGYIAKRGKRWIEEEAYLTSMYKHFEHSGTITLFCEGHSKSLNAKSRKRKASNYTDHEEDIDKLSLELKEKHGDKYNEQQLRLWARMIVNNQHDDMEEPPNIPIITGGIKQLARKETLTDALTSVATVLTKALVQKTQPPSPPSTPSSKCLAGISPTSKAKISTQYMSQLKCLQELRENGVLSETV